MSAPSTLAAIASDNKPLSALDADLLLIPSFEDDPPEAVPNLDAATGGEISRARTAGEFTGKPYDMFLTRVMDRTWRPQRVALVGAGTLADFETDVVRKIATAGGLLARQHRVGRVAFVLRGRGDRRALAQAAAEGLTLSEYDAGAYKTTDLSGAKSPSWIVASEDFDTNAAVTRGRVLGECSNLARGLANEPGNTLTPIEFARRIAALTAEVGLRVEVLDEKHIADLGMGLLLGVARGSAEPPRLIVVRYDPPDAPAAPVLGLVGKGITFDTGGISIKPADGMERMKDDMSGGAAVACAMRAIALLKAPIRVVGVVPATENMPGGRAIKPGDVLKSAEGKTVEVINTDAEGRLVLGDALWYARRLGATHLVDIATLTGAIMVALGKTTSGLFGTPPAWVEQIRRVAARTGDRVWPMPIFEDYRDQLKSEIADFTNTGGRPAGAITAALFLKEFAGGLPWAHLDVAGTAWADDAKPFQPKGPTGVGVRTLAELAFEQLEQKG